MSYSIKKTLLTLRIQMIQHFDSVQQRISRRRVSKFSHSVGSCCSVLIMYQSDSSIISPVSHSWTHTQAWNLNFDLKSIFHFHKSNFLLWKLNFPHHFYSLAYRFGVFTCYYLFQSIFYFHSFDNNSFLLYQLRDQRSGPCNESL